MTDLDREITEALIEAHGGVRVGVWLDGGKHGYWKYCTTCLKMQNHKEERIAGIMEWVCQVCGVSPIFPALKPIFKLAKRPKL